MTEDALYQSGEMLGKFEIIKELGRGGMGAVYLAKDSVLDRQVAIKVINRKLLSGGANTTRRSKIEQRFIREAKVSAVINHNNIASIHDAVLDGDQWYIAMEYINGESLENKIDAEDVFCSADAAGLAWQVVEGLQHAWDKHNVIHRDIKPGNVMIDTDGIAKLIDLGIAKPVIEDDDTHNLTMENEMIATPNYAAPEQMICSNSLTYKADIFALGVLLYEMLTHRKPFREKSSAGLYGKKSQGEYTPLTDLRNDLNPDLIAVIDRMLAPQPEDRPEFDELKEVFGTVYATGTSPAVESPNIHKSGKGVYIAVAACLIAVAAIGAFIMRPKSQEQPPDATEQSTDTVTPVAAGTKKEHRDFTFGKKLKLEMVWVPQLKGWMSRYETTFAQYKSLNSSHEVPPAGGVTFTSPLSPAVMVSRTDARKYCNWLNQLMGIPEGYAFRLPTRKEWQTCRGQGKTDRTDKLVTVGKCSNNSHGLFGMNGNVWELTEDGLACGGAWSSERWAVDPSKPDTDMRVGDTDEYHNIGFRIALMPKR